MHSAVHTRRGYWPSERTFNMALLGFCRRGGNGSKATNCSNLNRATATVPCLRKGKWLLATALLREMRRSEIQFSPLECWEKVWRLENSTAQELFSGPWHHFLHHVHFSHEAGHDPAKQSHHKGALYSFWIRSFYGGSGFWLRSFLLQVL